MSAFVYDDGFGNLVGEDGEESVIVEMEVDFEEYPLDSITNYDQYTNLKPPEKPVKKEKDKKKKVKEEPATEVPRKGRRSYRKYTDADKEDFFVLIYEKGLNVSRTGIHNFLAACTAQGWYDRDQENPQDIIQRKQAKNPVGRPPKLVEEHREFLVQLIDKKPSLVLDQVMDDLTSQFMDLEISKTALHDFMRAKCRISLKKAHFHSVDRNAPENLDNRFN